MAQIFKDVSNDYMEDGTGRIAIDAYMSDDGDGVIVAWVEKNGLVVPGEHSSPVHLTCSLVQEKIREAVIDQLGVKRISELENSISKLLNTIGLLMAKPNEINKGRTAAWMAKHYPVTEPIQEMADIYNRILNLVEHSKRQIEDKQQ